MGTYPDGIYLYEDREDVNKMKEELIKKEKTFSTMNAKHLLIWKVLEKYSQEGYQTINLGGIVNYSDKEDKYYGLTKFKLNFGSMIYEYMGDLELITSKPLYLMYKNSFFIIDSLEYTE